MSGKTKIVVLCIAYIIFKFCQSEPKPPSRIVRTDLGDIQGIKSVSRDGREYLEFLGIPYAKPPVGSLRFEAPQNAEKWVGVRSADKYGNECSQIQVIFGSQVGVGDEDCLFLNIFTPMVNSSLTLLPTMVFVHGGHFLEGSGNMYRPDYFMDEDVVLVTFNYRLGALGFLNSGDDVVRGNAGLKDQVKALEFVQRNIAQFGGDPKQTCLVGESAGGAATHFHMISPLSQGLFQKTISQSGNALEPWSVLKDPQAQAVRFGELANCPTGNTNLMVECLKQLPVTKILETHVESRDPLRDYHSIYLPSIETVKDEYAFLTEHPRIIVKTMKSGIPWLTGVNSHEGLISLATLARNDSLQTYLADPDNWLKAIPKLLFLKDLSQEQLIEIRNYYFGKEKSVNFEKHIKNYTNLFSDVYSNYGFMESVKYHSQHSPVFAYQFSYPGEFSLYNFLLAVKGEYPAFIEIFVHLARKWISKNLFGNSLPYYGCSHADELAYLFKLDMLHEITPQDKDFEMSKQMVNLWTSFAKDMNSMKFKDLKWKAFDVAKLDFEVLNIDRDSSYIKAPFVERVQFLKDTIFNS